MKVAAFVILFLLTLQGFSQETKLIARNGFYFNEEFYVLKTNDTIRHGTYLKYRIGFSGVRVLESGAYREGKKDGLWEYFNDSYGKYQRNSIREKGSYANGRKNGVWTYFYIDTVKEVIDQTRYGQKKKTDSIQVHIEQRSAKLRLAGMYLNDNRVGEWASFDYNGGPYQKYNFSRKILVYDQSVKDSLAYNTNRGPLFIGGIPSLHNYISSVLDFGVFVQNIRRDSTLVEVSFKVNSYGRVLHVNASRANGNKAVVGEAIRVITTTDNLWIPALSDGQPISSTLVYQFYIKKQSKTLFHTYFKLLLE